MVPATVWINAGLMFDDARWAHRLCTSAGLITPVASCCWSCRASLGDIPKACIASLIWRGDNFETEATRVLPLTPLGNVAVPPAGALLLSVAIAFWGDEIPGPAAADAPGASGPGVPYVPGAVVPAPL
jgi:hypothetical protein